ncbi:unnamed protein product [Closterium sp. Naga37s-1]|nr:unnamed protein product [Closterium sp. Naga37s-1]
MLEVTQDSVRPFRVDLLDYGIARRGPSLMHSFSRELRVPQYVQQPARWRGKDVGVLLPPSLHPPVRSPPALLGQGPRALPPTRTPSLLSSPAAPSMLYPAAPALQVLNASTGLAACGVMGQVKEVKARLGGVWAGAGNVKALRGKVKERAGQNKLLSLVAAVQQQQEGRAGAQESLAESGGVSTEGSPTGGVSAPIDLASLQQMREQQQALAREQDTLAKEQERLHKEQEEVKREQERVGRKQREVEREQRRMEEYQRQLAGWLLAAVVAVEELRRESGADTASGADGAGGADDAANGRAGGATLSSSSSPSATPEASLPAVDYWAE